MANIRKNNITNPPQQLTMTDVYGIVSAQGGPAKSCRFVVKIVPQGQYLVEKAANMRTIGQFRDLSYLCEAAEMPGRGFVNLDGRYYGPNFKIPFQSQYEDTSMTFICRTESMERQFFDDWMELINPTHLWNFNYRDSYTAQIHIYQIADTPVSNSADLVPKATYQWTLHDAYPIVVNPQQVSWADDNFQRLTISFTYTKWTRPKLDKQPTGLKSQKDFINSKGVEVVTGLPSKIIF